jgi:hypothetical protein
MSAATGESSQAVPARVAVMGAAAWASTQTVPARVALVAL